MGVQALSRLHPLGLTEDWSDKLQGQVFTSVNQRVTHEHYSQACAPPPPTGSAPPLLPTLDRRRLLHRPAAVAEALPAEDRRGGNIVISSYWSECQAIPRCFPFLPDYVS